MKRRSLLLGLTVSLIFNIAFLGSLGYRLWEKRKPKTAQSTRQIRDRRESRYRSDLTPELRERLKSLYEHASPRIKTIRTALAEERQALMELLMEAEPDSTLIEEYLVRIGRQQVNIERELISQLVKETEILPLEQRRRFLELVLKRDRSHRRRDSNSKRTEGQEKNRGSGSPDESRERERWKRYFE